MSILLIILGTSVLIAVTLDVLITTLTIGGGGPITSRLSAGLWALTLKAHRYGSKHKLLATVGLILLIGIALLWFTFTWIGWTLLFSAVETAVIKSSDKVPADTWERIYFVGYTLSTLGQGSYQAQGKIWQIATAIASANGFFLVTLTFAYLLPIVSAASRQRSCATYISTLGGTADEILARAWNGQNFGQFDQHLISLTPMLTQLGESHLTYPILHYFHSIERARSMSLSIVALDDALTLLQYGVKPNFRPDPAALGAVRRANAAFLKTLRSAYLEAANHDPPLPSLELLRVHGIPTVSESEFKQVTQKITQRRRLLLALVWDDGWTWDAIASTQTTSRSSSLDDNTIIDHVSLT